jgi:hypothetical protein
MGSVMHSELPEDQTVGSDNPTAATGGVTPVCDDTTQETAPPGEPVQTESVEGGDGSAVKEPQAETAAGQGGNQVQQRLDESPAATVNAISGNDAKLYSRVTNYNYLSPADKLEDLAPYILKTPLQPAKRLYQSINIAGYIGALLTHRIILICCRNKKVALNVAKSIAYENRDASKRLVTIQANCEGTYTLKHLIEQLARHKENDGQRERRSSQHVTDTVWVWEANDISESSISDISNTILDSLFISNARLDQYQTQLRDNGLCLICLLPPQKLHDYKRSDSEVDLHNWEIDFLHPMLEEYRPSEFEGLAETIVGQRQQGLWSADDAGFYNEIRKHLTAGKLPEVVAGKTGGEVHVDPGVEQLFGREDPLVDTALYCATFYPDLSPQDFSQLVQLFLDDAAEEVGKSTDQSQSEGEAANAVEPPTLTQRWRRESDAIFHRCKLAALTDENNKRVVDFQVDGLRSRLSQSIRDGHYFFYESKFVVMRRQGLLFSPRKKIAEGARQLLVEMATQYAPDEVANWLYEVIYEFEQVAQTADLLKERSQLFHLIPDARVKAARRYVCHGLSLVLSRLNKEPDLQEAARLFWQKLLQSERLWLLDLLRQIGNSAPAETLRWLKQVLDQGTKEIRVQAHGYLLGYLLRRDSLIYATLKELTQWPPDGRAGRAMHTLLIVYCVETNRRLPQQEYGKWPSSHPLFGFQDRAEARECMELLIGWVFTAAFEVDAAGGLSVIADIIAGWYLILSPPSQADPTEAVSPHEGVNHLDARAVRQLLLECLARYCSRSQKNSLLAIWESFRNDILEEVARFEEFTSQLADISSSAKLMKDTAAARRKLLDTRVSLGRLRRDFMSCAAEVIHG